MRLVARREGVLLVSGFWRRRNERRRRLFDMECWRLRGRGYSLEYIARRTVATTFEVESAVRRVECGRYGDEAKGGDGR